MISVLLADDQELLRAGFSMVLSAAHGITVVGEALDGADALRQVGRLDPDVVLMDVRMPGLDGIEATRRIVDSGARSRVLILTTFDVDAYAFDGVRAGASGFLLKDVAPSALVQAVRSVADGDAVLTPRITRLLLDRVSHDLPEPAGPNDDARLGPLTAREREILVHLATGASNAEIAERLTLSEATVKTHVSRVLTKLGLRDRAQAVVLAYESRLVVPGATPPG